MGLIDAAETYLDEFAEVKKERDYWQDMAKSNEVTIIRLCRALTEKEDCVPVILCKDCRLFGENWRCHAWHQFAMPEWFCSRAERREE